MQTFVKFYCRLFLALSFLGSASLALSQGQHLENTSRDSLVKVIFVRHAEVDLAALTANPDLTSEGRERAEVLAQIAIDNDVQVVYSTDYRRTIQTALPAARIIGSELQIYNGLRPDLLLAELATEIEARGRSILVVGHSNTVGPLIQAVGGPVVGDLEERAFESLFVVTLDQDSNFVSFKSYTY